jgi:hypothetical protein
MSLAAPAFVVTDLSAAFLEKLFDSNKRYSFKIVSTKKVGIRYLIRMPEEDTELVKKTLLSCLPGLSVREV